MVWFWLTAALTLGSGDHFPSASWVARSIGVHHLSWLIKNTFFFCRDSWKLSTRKMCEHIIYSGHVEIDLIPHSCFRGSEKARYSCLATCLPLKPTLKPTLLNLVCLFDLLFCFVFNSGEQVETSRGESKFFSLAGLCVKSFVVSTPGSKYVSPSQLWGSMGRCSESWDGRRVVMSSIRM